MGSERDSDRSAILACFLDCLNSDEFDVSYGHPLGLQKQVAEILIIASAVDQYTKVPADGFDHTFSAEQYEEFLAAESQGRYFLDHIRNHFPYERLGRR